MHRIQGAQKDVLVGLDRHPRVDVAQLLDFQHVEVPLAEIDALVGDHGHRAGGSVHTHGRHGFDDLRRCGVTIGRFQARRVEHDALPGAISLGSRGLAIAADFNALDRRIIKHLTESQANFVRDAYGRRNDAFGKEARRIVAEGLESGLGREDITRDLSRAAKKVIAGRGAFYWETVAGAFVANGRSFSQVSAFAEAGIQRYLIEAVLDERTTNTCRFLHGKTFSVGAALKRFDAIESLKQPEDVKSFQPWVREARDPKTGRTVLYVKKGARRVPVTEVVRSGLGKKDDTGQYRRSVGDQALMDLGLGFPPWHGLCRSSCLPIT